MACEQTLIIPIDTSCYLQEHANWSVLDPSIPSLAILPLIWKLKDQQYLCMYIYMTCLLFPLSPSVLPSSLSLPSSHLPFSPSSPTFLPSPFLLFATQLSFLVLNTLNLDHKTTSILWLSVSLPGPLYRDTKKEVPVVALGKGTCCVTLPWRGEELVCISATHLQGKGQVCLLQNLCSLPCDSSGAPSL